MSIEIKLERCDVQIVGKAFHYQGQMEPVGPVLDYLNTATRSTFPLYDVRVTPIEPGGPFKGVTRPEITVNGFELGLIHFADPAFRQRIQTLRDFDSVIAYTPHAVLRGRFHRGAEARLRDLFDAMQGKYMAMTDANVFPTIELPGPFPSQADLIIVNRDFIHLYHAD